MKPKLRPMSFASTLALLGLSLTAGVKADVAEPPTSCLKSIEHLKACLENKTITQEQYDVFSPSVAEMTGYLDKVKFTKRQQWKVDPARCEKDSLDPENGKGRTLWTSKHLGPRLAGDVVNALEEMKSSTRYPSLAQYSESEDKVPKWTYPEKKRAPTKESASYAGFEDWVIAATCVAGCYTPDQRISTSSGDDAIGEVSQKKNVEIKTLAQGASLDNLALQFTAADYFIKSDEPVQHDLVHIKTASGKELKLTKNHPLVISNGEIRTAESLSTGDELVLENGSSDQIVSKEPLIFNGLVHNVYLKSNDRSQNVVVAEGVLNGSAWYQNEQAHLLNRVLFRKQLKNGILPQ